MAHRGVGDDLMLVAVCFDDESLTVAEMSWVGLSRCRRRIVVVGLRLLSGWRPKQAGKQLFMIDRSHWRKVLLILLQKRGVAALTSGFI